MKQEHLRPGFTMTPVFFYIIEVTMKNNQAKESKRQRDERIAGTNNGMTLRTRTVPSKKQYNRQETNRKAFKEN